MKRLVVDLDMIRRSRWLGVLLLLSAILGAMRTSHAEEPSVRADPAADVRDAIRRGADFIASQQAEDGSWPWVYERQSTSSLWLPLPGTQGLTCMCLLALHEGGRSNDDPCVVKGLAYLRSVLRRPSSWSKPDLRTYTYAGGAFLWMMSVLRPEGFDGASSVVTHALVRGQLDDGLWGYRLPVVRLEGRYLFAESLPDDARLGDISNTQFAVFGVLAAESLGLARPTEKLWKRLGEWLKGNIDRDGGYSYRTRPRRGARASGSKSEQTSASSWQQTAIGVALHYLSAVRTGQRSDAVIRSRSMKRGLRYLTAHSFARVAKPKAPPSFDFRLKSGARLPGFMELLYLDRLEAWTGKGEPEGRPWFPAAREYLIGHQQEDGGWPAGEGWHSSFRNRTRTCLSALALLVLSHGVRRLSGVERVLTHEGLARARDLPEPIFSEFVVAGLAAWAAARDTEAKRDWVRGFVGLGRRGLEALAVLTAEAKGPPGRQADQLFQILVPECVKSMRAGSSSLRLKRWLGAHPSRPRVSADGLTFVWDAQSGGK